MSKTIETWEQSHINELTLKMIFLATGGTLLATAIAYVLKTSALGEINPELLFIPWGIVLVLGVSTAFKRGVAAERERATAVAAETKPVIKPTPARKKKAATKRKAAPKTATKTAAVATAPAVKAKAKKPAAKNTAAKKAAPKKAAVKKSVAKKAAPKKAAAKKPAAKKTTTKKK